MFYRAKVQYLFYTESAQNIFYLKHTLASPPLGEWMVAP